MIGHTTAVSGAMPLLSLHLACLFECGLGFGEGKVNHLGNNERRHQNKNKGVPQPHLCEKKRRVSTGVGNFYCKTIVLLEGSDPLSRKLINR